MAQQAEHGDEKGRRLWTEELVPMQPQQADYHVSPGYRPEIKHLTMGQPRTWLRQGWADLRRNPFIGLGYGLLIALLYGAIFAFALRTELYHVGIQLTAGFVLIAPVLALGFYEISRRNELGKPVKFRHVFKAWGRNPKGMLGMGVMMVLLFLTWFMISMWNAAFLAESKAEVALALGAENAPQFFRILVTNLTIPMVLGYFSTGLVAVLVAFAFTAVSIPLLMEHRDSDAITALVASWHAVTHNWKPMLLWAVLIAVITGIGLAVFYIGLAVTMPLLGFATWHAYRDTLGEWQEVKMPEVEYY